jgi:DNA repair protein SbcC/Rad50
MTPRDLVMKIQRRAGERDSVARSLAAFEEDLKQALADSEALERSQEIIRVTAKRTQEELEIHVSELVSLALEAVFPKPYKLVLKFELRRNRTEADLLLQDEKGNLVRPMDAVGGGVVDVAAFALRVALWSLRKPRPSPVMILDEPFRFLSRDLQARACQMLREISGKLGIQFLIVTHEEELMGAADRVFRVEKKKGETKVRAEP